MNQIDINYCTAEEADQRLIRHAINQASTGIKNIVVKTGDTNVLLVIWSWWENSLRHQEYCSISWRNTIKGVAFFHTLTGSDTTSSFFKHGKCAMWDAWMNVEEQDISKVFLELSDMPSIITESHVNIIERVV